MSEEINLITTPDAAKELGITPGHLRTMIATGKAHPKQRLGNNWLFTQAEIERLRHRKRTRGRPKKA